MKSIALACPALEVLQIPENRITGLEFVDIFNNAGFANLRVLNCRSNHHLVDYRPALRALHRPNMPKLERLIIPIPIGMACEQGSIIHLLQGRGIYIDRYCASDGYFPSACAQSGIVPSSCEQFIDYSGYQ